MIDRCYRIVRWHTAGDRGWVVVVDRYGDAEVWDALAYFDTYKGATEYIREVGQRQKLLGGRG